ncbi:ectonucleoside triphosphate diphosphohydrolase 8-like [Tachyglossus aculeatus]|uniref:ectonucleoside triphosphate diphosphohydrolase 8-like n=1 Tax=Tachyglossus aculeatus TaxID=9261 RepID=UPI0018F43F08|nr:ectonucleoside triphosphate diphosphohydrolase 8-like [Tachyglossus aculeatus]
MGHARKGLVLGILLTTAIGSGIVALILVIVETRDVYLPPETKYGMVFDAGSSHTALFVYRWPAGKENDTGIVSQALACSVKGPGISYYREEPTQAGESLRDCMREALGLIPDHLQRGTPTFLGATAGMRLLRLQNSSQADRLFEEISKTLRQFPVDFRGAQLLTGNEEGAFGWITINYLLESLVKYSFAGKWMPPTAAELVGSLDLGGASTQITFRPQSPSGDPSTQEDFRLYGGNYTVYTHSYLCYGRDQALKMLQAHLVQASNSSRVDHPCYPSGFQETLLLEGLYDSPCARPPKAYNPQSEILLRGTGDPEACFSAVRTIFNFSSCGGRKDCGFNGVFQPAVSGHFYAFSAFYYTFDFLNLTKGQSLSVTNATVWEFCKRNWDEMELSYPDQKKWLHNYCPTAVYILTLLMDGYKFTSESWSTISFCKQAADTDIGWSLGYMLNLTNMIPSEEPAGSRAQNRDVWIAAVFFVVLAVSLTTGALAVQYFGLPA